MGRRRVRLRDIAEEAGVSVSTVSLVLNDKAQDGNVRISSQTVRRVRQVAVELGYLARGIVGLIVPQIDNYWADMIMGVMGALKDKKYSLAMGLHTSWDLQREIEEIHAMADKHLDCLILTPPVGFSGQTERLPDLVKGRLRVLLMNWISPEDIPCVSVDHEQCGYIATRHLLELGHRRIAFLGVHYPSGDSETGNPILDARFRGYYSAMTEHNQPYVSVERAEGVFDLPARVTAAYCGRAHWATDLMCACVDRGVRVPEDLSVVGQDDNREREIMRPRVTAVDVRAREVGRLGAQMALELARGKRPKNAILEPRVVKRESTCAA